jgi:L-asparaginase II
MTNPILVEVTRGGVVESAHRGAIAVAVAGDGIIWSTGDIDRPVYPRSAVKGLQALHLIESGAADRYGLTEAEIALACASHSGEPAHVATAAAMLAKAGHDADALECGAHWPSREPVLRAMVARGETATALHNNCSGKHAGFVCAACATGTDPAGYVGADHPTMRAVSVVLEAMTGLAFAGGAHGIDGCSIPTYGIPLRQLATAFAAFGTGHGLPPGRAAAAARIRRAVAAEPFFVAGTGRFDTTIMAALGDRAFIKTGAEGVYCGALPEQGIGIALKCDDGGTRAAEAMMAALLARFVNLGTAEAAVLDRAMRPTLTNWNGISVGDVRPTAALLAIGADRES